MSQPRVGVLFVCLGNICRSPLAEAIFTRRAEEAGVRDRFDIDSAGIGGWHEGEPADPRAIRVGASRGYTVSSVARQIRPAADCSRFAWLIAMDRSNRARLLELGASVDRVLLARSIGSTGAERDVPDPYEWAESRFHEVIDILEPACVRLLDALTVGLRGS